jgi:3-oxoacyl-[acyl-carrier protein] reductase
VSGHVAIITGANHGIGAAVAEDLAGRGVAVVINYLRLKDDPDAGIPEAYRANRAQDAAAVLGRVEAAGGSAIAVEADLSDDSTPTLLFDAAEAEYGPVDILVNNATGWLADTFKPVPTDRLGRGLQSVSPATIAQQFAIDARGGALMIAEFARRHAARGGSWGRIVGLTSGGPSGFPEEASYGAAKAALDNYTMTAAIELADLGVTANMVHPPVTDTGWVTDEVREFVAGSAHLTHVATPQDVAEVIGYLVSDEARLVSGNVIRLR